MCYNTHTSKVCIVLYLEEKEPINHRKLYVQRILNATK